MSRSTELGGATIDFFKFLTLLLFGFRFFRRFAIFINSNKSCILAARVRVNSNESQTYRIL